MTEHDQVRSPSTELWLQQRRQSGNWVDIAEADEIPADIEGWYRTVLHMFQIAFAPEIRHRLSSKKLGKNFILTAAQMLQSEEGGRIIRLNEEVRGTALVRATRPIQAGETVFASDLRNFISFDLEEDDLNAGHFTMLWTGEEWIVTFDFRAGRAKCSDMLKMATQFLEAAKFSVEKGHARPSVDNLFSACELVSKAHLILYHRPGSKAKTHAPVKSAINDWGRIGNVNTEFVRLFNEVSNTRYPARYDASAQVELPSRSDFQIVEREIETLAKHVARRVTPPQS